MPGGTAKARGLFRYRSRSALSTPTAKARADHFRKNLVLATGYGLAGVMAIVIIALPASVWTLGAVFVLGGIYVGIEETLEDSLCAELVDEVHHGMAFGVLATVNGIGDFFPAQLSACFGLPRAHR